MKVKLKYPAYAKKRRFEAGVHDDWPDDVDLPSTAKELKKGDPAENAPPSVRTSEPPIGSDKRTAEEALKKADEDPNTLSELAKKK